jgi:hypothetical protein
MKKVVFSSLLLMLVTSGCSIVHNSERFYGRHPISAIYWNEYRHRTGDYRAHRESYKSERYATKAPGK